MFIMWLWLAPGLEPASSRRSLVIREGRGNPFWTNCGCAPLGDRSPHSLCTELSIVQRVLGAEPGRCCPFLLEEQQKRWAVAESGGAGPRLSGVVPGPPFHGWNGLLTLRVSAPARSCPCVSPRVPVRRERRSHPCKAPGRPPGSESQLHQSCRYYYLSSGTLAGRTVESKKGPLLGWQSSDGNRY